MKFHTDYKFTNRETKSKYVFEKYKNILKESVLDVGADQCGLKSFLDTNVEYAGIGLASKFSNLDFEIDLEKTSLPYDNDSFHTVLCFDVLEHLENIHHVFDELCRVSKKYVIISLPNPYKNFINILRDKSSHLKFYGLPEEKPNDRHKWFFSATDAKNFIEYRARKNKLKVLQIDGNVKPAKSFWLKIKGFIKKRFLGIDINREEFMGRTIWAVLEK